MITSRYPRHLGELPGETLGSFEEGQLQLCAGHPLPMSCARDQYHRKWSPWSPKRADQVLRVIWRPYRSGDSLAIPGILPRRRGVFRIVTEENRWSSEASKVTESSRLRLLLRLLLRRLALQDSDHVLLQLQTLALRPQHLLYHLLQGRQCCARTARKGREMPAATTNASLPCKA